MSTLKRVDDYPASLEAAWREHLAPRRRGAPTVVSLFAGCGGSSLGYSMAGFRELLAVEWWDRAAAAFRENFPRVPVHEGDIATLSGAEALRLAGVVGGELDLLDGSPPCQGFSTAGRRELSDGRNSLFREYVRLLRAFRPRAFVMENVSGMARGVMALVFAKAMRELKASGYRVSCRLLDAQYFGVPQVRRRLIFIGVRDGLGIPPSHPGPQTRPVSVAQALGLDGGDSIDFWRYAFGDGARGASRPVVKRGFGCIRNEQFFNKYRGLGAPSPMLEAVRPPVVVGVHAPHVVEQWAGDGRYVGSFHSVRLEAGAPVDTQTAAHWHWMPDEPRELTNEEAKALQSFPPRFKIPDGGAGYRMVGNSVPPLMARAIALHIRREILDRIREAA